jgi:chaperone required for assembly of F1-ATPase
LKKFYQKAEAGTAPGGYAVRLDGRVLKTPLKNSIILKNISQAEAIAAEWNAQAKEIVPDSMPLTQLLNTMIDKSSGADRVQMNEAVARYAAADMLCYFSDHPSGLVARQEKLWKPLLAWLNRARGIRLESVSGIRFHEQSENALQLISQKIAALDAVDFTVLQASAGLTGSVVIAWALLAREITPEQAQEACCVDELYQLEKWGEDGIARDRINRIGDELRAIALFRDLFTAS